MTSLLSTYNIIEAVLTFIIYFGILFWQDNRLRPKFITNNFKKYKITYLILAIPSFVAIVIGCLNYGWNVNIMFAGVCITLFIRLALLDIKYGEMYMKDILALLVSVVFLGITYHLCFGCTCMLKNIIVFEAVAFLLIVIDDFVNTQISIGGADFDCLFILIGAVLAIIKTWTEKMDIATFAIGDFLSVIFEYTFINCFVYTITYVIIFKIRHKKMNTRDIRMLPAFTLPFIYTLLMLFSKAKGI